MDKLKTINEFLEGNPEIDIINVNKIDYLKNIYTRIDSAFGQIYDYCVAPRDSFLLDNLVSSKLQSFMMDLIPNGLEPDKIYNFENEGGILKVGQLIFDENIGEEKISTVRSLNLNDGLNIKDYLSDIRDNVTKEYIRRIIVSPFPSKEVATLYFGYSYVGYIDLNKVLRLLEEGKL